MYNIIQLNDMELSALQSIAKELGIQNAESMKKDELVYGILDEQAIANASKKAVNKDKEAQPKKRSRISKKEGDKVYTASQDKAQKLEANTPDIPAKVSPFNSDSDAKKEEVEVPVQAPVSEVKTEVTEEKIAQIPPIMKKLKKKKGTLHLENYSAGNETITFAIGEFPEEN